MSLALSKLKKKPTGERTKEKKKKTNRFDGLSEEEVQKYTLEDILEPDLDLVFVGINPSLMAAHRGRYYAGAGNHFYKLLHASGLVPRFVSFEEDKKLLDYKIGLTNIVTRATRSSADLKKSEIKEGSAVVRDKLEIFKPKIAIFNGKCIYEVFAEKTGKSEFTFGLQSQRVGQTVIWVVPSSSARCSHFPRMVDKLHFYLALKKYLSFLKGEITEVDSSDFRFEGKCKQSIPGTSKMWRRKNVSAFVNGGRVANKETIRRNDSTFEETFVPEERELVVTEIVGENYQRESASRCENVEDGVEGNYLDESVEKIGQRTKKGASSRDSLVICSKITVDRLKEKPVASAANESSSPLDAFKPRDNGHSVDFMSLIKRRLSERHKRDRSELEEKETFTSIIMPVERGKKLKYANLRLNSGVKISNDSSETFPETKVFSD